MNKKEIIDTLEFVKSREPLDIDNTTKDNRLPIIDKLHADEYLSGIRIDAFREKLPSFATLRITIKGTLLLEELQAQQYEASFKGKSLPRIEKAIWLIFGAFLGIVCSLWVNR